VRIPRLLLLAIAATVVAPGPGEAQERTWRLSVVGEAGYLKPIRSLGNNSTEVESVAVFQVITDVEPAPWVGGGLQIEIPARELRFRGVYRRTLDGSSRSRLAVCGDPDDPNFVGALCEPVESDAVLETVLFDVSVPRGSPTALVRPMLHLGVGLRRWSFGFDQDATCIDPDQQWTDVCDLAADVWRDPGGLTPFLNFGLGLTTGVGPARAYGEALANTGPYRGGAGRADGNFQVDLTFNVGLAIPIY
jgi:hypothetical protein